MVAASVAVWAARSAPEGAQYRMDPRTFHSFV
jgi:hypothetical protein